jgi:hypothetical protein
MENNLEEEEKIWKAIEKKKEKKRPKTKNDLKNNLNHKFRGKPILGLAQLSKIGMSLFWSERGACTVLRRS